MPVALGDRVFAQLHATIRVPHQERGEAEPRRGHHESERVALSLMRPNASSYRRNAARHVATHHRAHAEEDGRDGRVAGVADPLGQVATRLEPRLATVDVALVEGVPAVDPQQLCALRGRLVHDLEDSMHPVPTLAEEAADHGLRGDGADHVHRAVDRLVRLVEAER